MESTLRCRRPLCGNGRESTEGGPWVTLCDNGRESMGGGPWVTRCGNQRQSMEGRPWVTRCGNGRESTEGAPCVTLCGNGRESIGEGPTATNQCVLVSATRSEREILIVSSTQVFSIPLIHHHKCIYCFQRAGMHTELNTEVQ